MAEILSEQNTKKQFRVFYFDHNWCEIEALRVEHARAEIVYAAVGTWLLCKVIGAEFLDGQAKQLLKAESLTVEEMYE
jgi:hypothetical protein